MGDGRYYTYYQFFSVILITILTMFVIANIVYSYYRNSKRDNMKSVYIIFYSILVFIIARIIESVTPSIELAINLRNIQAIVFLLVNILILYYLFKIRYSILKLKNLNKQFILAFTSMGIVLYSSKILIKSYSFHNIKYSNIFFLIIFLFLILSIVLTTQVYFCKNKLNYIYSNKIIILLLSTFLIFPLLMYLLALIYQYQYIDFIEIAIFFIISIVLSLHVYTYSESGLTRYVFDKVGDVITDYVFVVDLSGHIIYRNQSVRNSILFTDSEVIDINNIRDLYNKQIDIKSNQIGKEYIQLKSNKSNLYFIYKKNMLKNKEKIIGYIITIIEITDLMSLLFDLQDKKEELKKVNMKLKNYSKVVYHFEKEKEINALLEKIITSGAERMTYLADMINNTKENIDEPLFEKQIDITIRKSNEILEDVRKMVSTYREYYGG